MNTYTRRLEHQLYLARENPEPLFDLSDCDLKAVPSGVFAICKVLQKQILVLQKNKLESLDGGGSLRDLLTIRELDLSNNRFKHLPADFATSLCNLRKLNLSGNRLVDLPTNFGNLKELEELDLTGNPKLGKLSEILPACAKLTRLFIDESHPEVALANTLQLNGAAAIVAKSSEHDKVSTTRSDTCVSKAAEDIIAADYEARDRQRKSLVHELFVEDERTNAEMRQLIEAKRSEHDRFCAAIAAQEAAVRSLIDRILVSNEAARRADQNVINTNERAFYLNAARVELRVQREQVVAHMQAELERSERLAELFKREQADTLQAAKSQVERDAGVIDAALSRRDQLHAQLIKVVAEDQRIQKIMFEELQRARDAVHGRLVEAIAQVEAQLVTLTELDNQRRQLVDETQRQTITEQRERLVELLNVLLAAKARREAELSELLAELEAQRSSEQVDFWLVQYQRLLDSTPDALLSKMFDLSQVVVDVLIDADAQDYIPVFKRHRITLQQFLDLTDVDLRSLGIALVGMRKSILSHIQRFRDCRQVKTDELQPAFSDLRLQPNSAASASGTSTSTTSTTTTTTAVRIALECCVCLDARCDTVFLTCGHVCTCRDCAIALQQCPLCRVPIAHKLPLLFTS